MRAAWRLCFASCVVSLLLSWLTQDPIFSLLAMMSGALGFANWIVNGSDDA